jgi:hypothetical protein
MRAMVSRAPSRSGWAKIVRRVAVTMCWAALGDRRGRVAHEVRPWRSHVAPVWTRATCLSPRCEPEVTRRTPRSPRPAGEGKSSQNSRSSAGPQQIQECHSEVGHSCGPPSVGLATHLEPHGGPSCQRAEGFTPLKATQMRPNQQRNREDNLGPAIHVIFL